MPDDRLISRGAGHAPLPVERHEAGALAHPGEAYFPAFEPEAAPFDWRRYVFAILRYKWLLLAAIAIHFLWPKAE